MDSSTGQMNDNSTGQMNGNLTGQMKNNVVGQMKDNSVGDFALHRGPELVEDGRLVPRNFVKTVSLAKRIDALTESASTIWFGGSSQPGIAIGNGHNSQGFVTLSSMLPINHPNLKVGQTSFSPIEKFPDTEGRLNGSNVTILPRRKPILLLGKNSLLSN